jgi:hypothetical protein
MKPNVHFSSYLAHFLSEWEMFKKNVVEKIKTLFLFSYFFLKACRLGDKVEKKNIVERGRPQMIIWRMRIACWIPKATITHTKGV